ncbi:MAG: sortase [Candidatus Gottesmanbacteria bacterium]
MIKKLLFLTPLLILILFLYGEIIKKELAYWSDDLWGQKHSLDSSSQWPESGVIPITPINRDFCLVIPKINLNSAIVSINSENTPENLTVLKQGLIHTRESAFPDQRGPIIILAHLPDNIVNLLHTNVSSYLFNKIVINDEIDLFYLSKRYKYYVTYKIILSTEDTKAYINSIQNKDVLILQASYPPILPFKKLLIIADKQN